MRTILLVAQVLWLGVCLPFWLLDYLALELPREIRAKRWRKRIAVGDRAYFFNMLGTTTHGELRNVDYDKRMALVVTANSSGWHQFDGLYPDGKEK